MAVTNPTINELDFCAQIASTANQLIGENPTAFPFYEARIEGYGTGTEKMEQRANSDSRRFSVHDLAADIWDAAEFEDAKPLGEWVSEQPESVVAVVIPDEQPARVSTDVMFSPNIVFFGRNRPTAVEFTTRGQAELVGRLANEGVTGHITIPLTLEDCFKLLDRVNRRLERARARFQELAESRTGDERIRTQLVEVLQRWYAVGSSK